MSAPASESASAIGLREEEALATVEVLTSEDFPPVRLRRRHRSAFPSLLLADAVAVAVALVGGRLIYWVLTGRGSFSQSWAALLYLPLFITVIGCYGLYRQGRRRLVGSSFPDLSHLVHSIVIASLLLLFAAGAGHRWASLPAIDRRGATVIGGMALLTVPIFRAVARWWGRRGADHAPRVLIVGSGMVAASVAARLVHVGGLEVIGCVDDNAMTKIGPWAEMDLLGGLDDLPDLVAEHDVDHIVVAFSPQTGARLAATLRSLAGEVQISVVPRLFDLLTVRSRVDDLAGLTVVDVAPASLGPADRFAKRALDIFASALGLLLLSPLFIVVAIGIKATSPGPVLFRQSRTGRRGKTFAICKFRTMRVGAEQERQELVANNEVDGPLFKMKSDPRATDLGRFLRKTSIDELPQLINVLKGDMSLVGPRPFVTSESAEIAGWAAKRFDVRPGMTGLWQISGRNDLPFDELCRLDYSYVASWSLWWDLRILWHTPGTTLRRRGAY